MALGGLDSALSGLRVAQQQLSVISSNISNASTPGYTRKILPQEALAVNGQALGVLSDPIVRDVDMNLESEFWTQSSSVSALTTTAAYLTKIQQFHGDPSAETNISAQLGKLHDAFSALADSPEDPSLQRAVVDQAQEVASKISGFGQLLNQMRSDAQNDMSNSVTDINNLLGQISTFNQQISQAVAAGTTTAELSDQRDQAIQNLSKEMNITTFTRADGVMVVQTGNGTLLADENPQTVYFKPSSLGAQSYYPASAAGVYVGGNPATHPTAVDITATPIGGKLGALVTLRDATLPQQQAAIDELAEKTAQRFAGQGLSLFGDASGNIPPDTNPTPSPPGPLTPVPYVGFAAQFQVNKAVIANNALVQTGTVPTDVPVQNGSNEVIRRVADYAFGDVDYQQAVGNVDVRAAATGGTTLQQWFGLYSSNQVLSKTDLSQYSDVNALINAGGTTFNGPPLTDSFTLTFEEPRTGAGPVSVNVDLTQAGIDFPIGGATTDALDQITQEINKVIAAAPVPASLAASASTNANGQLVINSRGNITVDASAPGQMRDAGLQIMGLTPGTQNTTDPTLTIQVGSDNPAQVAIEPGDDETDLMAKLNYNPLTGTGIPGLDATLDPVTGFLTLRPGGVNGSGAPYFGGDLTVTGNALTADGTGASGAPPAGSSVLKSLFGTDAPLANVDYATTDPFRTTNLGQGANITTNVLSSTNIIDYAQNMINSQSDDITNVNNQNTDATNYQNLLQSQLQNNSGVNIDQEMASMITAQTAYAAAAHAISVINQSFQDLLNAIGT